MPLPAILAGAASVLAVAMVVDDLVTGGRVSDAVGRTVGKKAAQAVLDARGIPLDLDGEVNQYTITRALNAAVMPEGVVFENLFDKEQVRRDIKKIALDYAATAFGYEAGLSPKSLKASIISGVTEQVNREIIEGAGEYLDAAKGVTKIDRMIAAVPSRDWQAPRVFTKKAQLNREHQEKYRNSHSRVWRQVIA